MRLTDGTFRSSNLKEISQHLAGTNEYFCSLELTFSLLRRWRVSLLGFFLLLVVPSLSAEAANQPYVHYFSCDQCHYAGMPYYEIINVCLNCHTDGKGTSPIMDNPPPGVDGTTEGLFLPGDASNVGGNNPDLKDFETSHNWYAPTDTRPEFGASAPLRTTENRFFYSRYGTSTGKITCSRCHLPHAYTDNPQLLVMGPDSADKMCKTCHQSWVLDEHGWLTHPIIDNYNASVAEYPGKYRSPLVNKDQADIKLVGGGVSCTSCHGAHFVDSDSTTTDGHSTLLSKSNGKLLRGDGPDRADKSSLCQTCHTYQEHGDNTGEKVGCMVCHSGHSYAPDFPNYYVLRKSATTTTYNTVTGLNYSSTDVLNAGLVYTFWNDQDPNTANGYCEKCHGDAGTIGVGAGDYHITTAVCTDCHSHSGTTGSSFSADCDACHAYPPVWANHRIHLDSGRLSNTPTCETCHITSIHLNDLSEIRFDPDDLRVESGAYSGTEPSRYLVDTGYNPTTPAYGECDNVYCHSNAQGQTDPTLAPDYKTPTWDGAIVRACRGCHNVGAHGGAPAMATGSHTTHLAYIFGNTNTIISCQACHYLGEDATCVPCHLNHTDYGDSTYNRMDKHVDGNIDVDFHPEAAGVSAAYTGDAVPQTAYGSCNTTYCHSLGELSVTPGQLPAAYGGNLYRAPDWGGSALDCNGCHGLSTTDGEPDYTSGSAGAENANSHVPHVADNQIGCQKCHFGTTKDGVTISYDGLYRKHANGVNTDVEYNSSGLNQQASYTPGKTCDNTYCHSDGTIVATGYYLPESLDTVTNPWGTSGDGFACDDCHGYPPNYGNYDPKANSHVRHDFPWLGCEACHYTTTTDGITITNFANHMNNGYDVSPSPTYDRGAQSGANTFTYTFDPGGGTCNSISCHSGIMAADKKWGNSSLSTNFFYGFQECYGVTFTESSTSCFPTSACVEPYSYIWDFGDGTVINGSSQETHNYGIKGSWDVTLTTISGNGLSGTRTIPNITIDNVVVFNNNNKPTYDDPPGPVSVSVNGLEVTITDLHTDADFSCYTAEYGDGLVKIDWGPTAYIDYPITLSETPSNTTFTYTYASPGTYTVRYAIRDNVMTTPEFIPNLQITVP